MWVFGYGSLIWKVDFPYEEKIVGYIKNFQRRFYQHSTDHRGIPGKPGRVVTLVPGDETDRVYGIAYKISDQEKESVVKHLDYREKGGYVRTPVFFYPKDKGKQPFEIIIYVANDDNPQYAGPADADSIANQVVKSVGPSGTNIEYVFNLAKAMRDIAPEVNDEHLFTIERKVQNLLKFNTPESFSRSLN
ncbi:putative glutathione-specific gamma-glutamylcyclotransferase 2 [Tribolium madens]|uniref:putative glutathione-specific gamma-glutamylcyclotransferase 2 n=1 Tax=Tribolium madens TaxID=41895 RepID=UPI001CF73D6B|nr:putative glutathione-specific gamma-glutamylcyclotransferase 2 [Tribolium madens]